MKQADTSSLSPEIENQWLKNVYSFEQQYKDAKRVKVYDIIGRPSFKKFEELSPEEVPIALQQILSVMEEKNIALDCCCTYEDALIYRFITEELFQYEVDDISIEGMVQHFIYEEFYPNHDYDLRRHAQDFFQTLLARDWDIEFNSHTLAATVSCKGNSYDVEGITAIIHAFQKDRTFTLEKFEIEQVTFDIQKGEGKVHGRLEYRAYSKEGNQFYQGDSEVLFALEFDYWCLSGFSLPGLGD
jgi:hypothetical protein